MTNRHPKMDRVIAELSELLGSRCSTATAVREQHGKDESWHFPKAPDVVCFAKSTEEVSQIVSICAAHKVPVIPFAAGTSLEGHVNAVSGGVSIDLNEMNEILRVSPEDLDCTVQPGVRRKQLNEYLRDTGLFFPIDPGADASVGGMASTRASGTNAVRYGTMRENILSLKVVLPDGRVISTGHRAKKSAAGYDLTKLYIGSEGTLGVITEVTLKLYGIPEAISAATVSFPDIEGAIQSVILTIQSGIPVARIELLDEVQVDAVNRYSNLDLTVQPTLFLEFHGSEASVKEQAEQVSAICAEFGAEGFKWTTQAEERTKLWQARHDAAYAAMALRNGAQIWATDVCVPISRLADCILETKKDLADSFLVAPLVGHVGDGNFHLSFVIKKENPEELEEAERLNARLIERALSMDGTCTGEHGVGLGKKKYMYMEHGEAVDVMAALKHALDPDNIMNPGKIIPDRAAE
ncbi:FAD-linked oxidase C-terminal domain-containing protein [Sneathiella sp.]|uniref:FAD-binding oxidoreductase n=1 Tax=Sneathiella sp. TaxID=1964365 RepID=UPI00261D8478|nr:FAD-linked oxidase C-terminal domain-containing protein [Sneathiella sp.]MDF2365979.1 FAD-linked oxidase C-terminal domain-containing protein [Sneathiella sp.]